MSIFKKSIFVGAILSLLAVPFSVGTSVKAAESSDLEKVQIRVMSYNIHHAEGSDGKLALKRIGDIIKDSQADVIGLQEVDNNFGPRSNFEDQAKLLSEYLGMEYAYGANLDNGGHQYGTAVLSKYPIVSSQNHLLFSTSEQRGLLETVVDVKGTQFRFFNTHLDHLKAEERTRQIKEVLEWGGKNEGPAIFVGDFNAIPDSAEMQPMMQAYNDVFGSLGQNEDYTDPLPKPVKRIDYIFASENIGMKNADVLLTETTRVASDHLPIIADLMFGLTEIKLNSITAPAPVTAAIGTAKTAAALGLPAKVTLVTDVGSLAASVNWDVNRANYDPTLTTEQTFTVTGTVTLPAGVINPNNVPLTTSISVSTKPVDLVVAHWKFDEGSGTTVGDSSGKGNIGTLVNNPTWTDSGKIGGALAFSGGSRVVFNAPTTLNQTGDESVSLWFKTSQPATGNANLFRHDQRFTALQVTGGGQARAAYWTKGSSGYKALSFPWTYNDNNWHHYVASYNQATGLTIYVDGNVVASTGANLGPLSAVTNKIVLGANETGGEAYKGMLDDVRVFNGALTQAEVTQLMNAGMPQSTLTGAHQAAPGQTFDLTMGLSGVTESVYQQIYAQDLTLHYDPAKLQFDSVTSLRDEFEVIDHREIVPGQIRIVAASVGGKQGVSAQGDLLKFKFTVKSEVQETDTAVSVGDVAIANGEGNELPLNGASHALQIRIPVDKSGLNAAITSAQTKHDAAVEGNENGLYAKGSKAQLQSAIDAAKATANDSNVTQQQVDTAKSLLEAAIQVFESKKISADVNGKDGITVGDLAIVAAAYGKQEGQPGWNAKADVNHDGKVDIEDLAIVAKAILQ
ncbi:endonuclease/exonuclease/phosphatase family protein [Paenibacillus sp. GCM10027629]|uniref:endonuclease/exonuclease/phosphatase family protein n=1 Tax=Paenibacillus sp. GCM10027629 TaxID=3273414 RepID=UPI003638F42E